MPARKLLRTALLATALVTSLGLSLPAPAAVISEWGTVSTSISGETSFSFARYDIDKNFTDLYTFTLEGSSGASYYVDFSFDACRSGCGNPNLSYGIYYANGPLVTATDGSVLLSPGQYTFQVKGNGFGAGNSLDYFGNVTFSLASATSMVSPVPEPAMLLLTVPGLALVAAATRRRQRPALAVS